MRSSCGIVNCPRVPVLQYLHSEIAHVRQPVDQHCKKNAEKGSRGKAESLAHGLASELRKQLLEALYGPYERPSNCGKKLANQGSALFHRGL